MRASFFAAIAFCPALAGSAVAAAVPGAVTLGTISPADPKGIVPAISAVPGAGVTNFDIPYPVRLITHGNTYVVDVASQNFAFSGTCVSGYVITQKVGTTVTTLARAVTKPYTCNANTIWLWAFGLPAFPNKPGAATLVAYVKYGTTVEATGTSLTIQ